MWGKNSLLSNITGQLSQLTQEVIGEENEQEDEDEDEDEENSEKEDDKEHPIHETKQNRTDNSASKGHDSGDGITQQSSETIKAQQVQIENYKNDLQTLLNQLNEIKLQNENLLQQNKRHVAEKLEFELHMVQTRLKNDIAMEAHPSHKETSSENNISHEDQHLLTQIKELTTSLTHEKEHNKLLLQTTQQQEGNVRLLQDQQSHNIMTEGNYTELISRHKQTLINLEKIRSEMEEKTLQWETTLKEHRGQLAKQNATIQLLKTENEELKTNHSAQTHDVQEAQLTLQNLSTMTSELETKQHEIASLTLQNQSLSSKMNELEEQFKLKSQTDTEEIHKCRDALERANKELVRLRQHLMEVEESHTQDEVLKEDQIKELKIRLAESQTREQEMKDRLKEFEKIKKHLYDKEQECQKISEALNNLQNVLEQFQAEQEQQIQSELLLLKTELSHHKSEAEKLRKEVVEFKEIQKRCQEAEQSVRELQEELSKKTRAFIKLQEDVEPLRNALDDTLKRLTNMTKNEENLVDKRMVSKLFITYVEGKTNKREVLDVMARILNFSEEEKQRIGLTNSRWSLIPKFGSESEKNKSPAEKSLTDLWVDFLLKEAAAEQTV